MAQSQGHFRVSGEGEDHLQASKVGQEEAVAHAAGHRGGRGLRINSKHHSLDLTRLESFLKSEDTLGPARGVDTYFLELRNVFMYAASNAVCQDSQYSFTRPALLPLLYCTENSRIYRAASFTTGWKSVFSIIFPMYN